MTVLKGKPINKEFFSIKAFICNLSEYNKGNLAGFWHIFPTHKKSLLNKLKKININEKCTDELFITDYESDIRILRKYLGEYENLNELNYLAHKICSLKSYDMVKFISAIEFGEYCSSIEEIINLTDNLDCFDYIDNVHNLEDLAYIIVEDYGLIDAKQLGELARYFDYESFGRDFSINEGGMFTKNGYIYLNGEQFMNIYNGKNMPDIYRVV